MPGAQKKIYALSRTSRCYECDQKLEIDALVLLKIEKDDREVSCHKCAGLADYVMVPSKNARVTNVAKKLAQDLYVIMKWSELWKSYERQGILIDPKAAKQVEAELGIQLT